MRGYLGVLSAGVGLGVMLCAGGAGAQAQDDAKAKDNTVHVFDGGTRQTLESIFIPPTLHAPFSLVLATEWTRPLANSGTYTLANRRRIMRDSDGRIYEERWLLAPKGGKQQSQMNYIQIADPALHTQYNCEVVRKTCFLLFYSASPRTLYKPGIGASGPLPDGSGFHTHEDLGSDNIQGIDTAGYRETTTINRGVYGNDQPMVSIREFWYSAQLGINLASRLESPQSGKQTFKVVELSTSEPDPQFFQLPDGYSVVDQRQAQGGSN